MNAQQRGLMMVCWCITLMGLMGAVVYWSHLTHLWMLQPNTHSVSVRQTLLMFSSLQGFSANSEFGRLPCPDRNNDGVADSPCYQQDRILGYLPLKTKVSSNVWISGLPAPANNAGWMYGVAPRVTNGTPVDWTNLQTQPDLLTVLNNENQVMCSQVVAVVARSLSLTLTPNVLTADGRYECLSYAELAAAMQLKARSLMTQSTAYLLNNNIQHLNTPNTPQLVQQNTQLLPQGSGCQCGCTKTQCNCSCGVTSQWRSDASCLPQSTGQCAVRNNQYECTAQANQTCLFKGSARLVSAWPVSRYSPQPVPSSACAKVSLAHQCPLSNTSSSCVCQFDWPVSLNAQALQSMVIERPSTTSLSVRSSVALNQPSTAGLVMRRAHAPDFLVDQTATLYSLSQ